MDAEFGYVNYLQVIEGAIVQSYTVEIKKKLDEEPAAFLHLAIPEIRDLFGSTARTIFTSHPVELQIEGSTIHVPQKGEKKKLIELSNAPSSPLTPWNCRLKGAPSMYHKKVKRKNSSN